MVRDGTDKVGTERTNEKGLKAAESFGERKSSVDKSIRSSLCYMYAGSLPFLLQ